MTLTDDRAAGLTSSPVEALRYENVINHPLESSGKTIQMVPRGARVLDVGCGIGGLGQLLRDVRGAEVIGIEPHPARAEAARLRGLTVHTGLLDAPLLANLGQFDVILFADVLEHLVAPEEMLRLAATGLRPDGTVIASTPNVAHWTVRLSLLAGNFDYAPIGIMDATHLRWFTVKTIDQLFESAGFQIVEYAGAAGTWMKQYGQWPIAWIPTKRRHQMVHWLAQKIPGLFACQHVVRAVRR